jgi:hypothetical protein
LEILMTAYAAQLPLGTGVAAQALSGDSEAWQAHSNPDLQMIGRALKLVATPAIAKLGIVTPKFFLAAGGAYASGAGIQTADRLKAEKKHAAASGTKARSGVLHTVATFAHYLHPAS